MEFVTCLSFVVKGLPCCQHSGSHKAIVPGTANDAKEGGLYVRSASRQAAQGGDLFILVYRQIQLIFVLLSALCQGTYDFGVNAVRLNRIAKEK